MIIVLFDVDMTLIDPAGAGREAMTSAFREMFGVEDGLEGVPFAGRTDRYILRESLARHGLLDDGFDAVVPSFAALYARHLGTVLPRRPCRVLAGVPELIAALMTRGARIGLATGNFRQGAMIKLAHCRLDEWLTEGAFGDDHIDRADLVAAAAARLDGAAPQRGAGAGCRSERGPGEADPGPESERGPGEADGARDGHAAAGRRQEAEHASGGDATRRVVVVGDTPHDVAAALANGFRAVAVATGFTSAEALAAAGADHVLPDFSDTATALAAIL